MKSCNFESILITNALLENISTLKMNNNNNNNNNNDGVEAP